MRFSRLVVAAVLLPAFAHADVDPTLSKDMLDEAEQDQSLQKRRLRNGHRGNPALLKYEHHLDQLADSAVEDGDVAALESNLGEAAELMDNDVAAPPMALPGRHPAVEKALDGMAGDLQNLQEKREAAKESRTGLENTVTNTFQHMNDAVAIKQAMAKKEAQLRRESGRLKVLEWDEGRLDSTHQNLVTSLHRMLDPKLMKARVRFTKKEAIFHKDEHAAMAWKQKRDQLKASAMELIKRKKESHQSLLQAEEEVAQAKKKEELARIRFERDRTKTAEQVQSYRYAETRFKAELQHEKTAHTAAKAAHDSVENLHHVYGIEQQKVEQSIGFRKQRLEHQMSEVQAARQKTSQELADLKQKFQDWQQMQRERTAAVVKQTQDTEKASDAFAARQQQVLDSAQAKVVRDAEGVGDWDGWGNDFSKVADELDD